MQAHFRSLAPSDIPVIERMLVKIKEFNSDDQLLAMELLLIAIDQPNQKDYEFIIAVGEEGQAIGYICFGPTPITDRTYDLYWIVVDPDYSGNGIGTQLLLAMERILEARNARMVIIETSSDPIYTRTRQFYLKNGYRLAECIQDFFQDGEDRITFVKRIKA